MGKKISLGLLTALVTFLTTLSITSSKQELSVSIGTNRLVVEKGIFNVEVDTLAWIERREKELFTKDGYLRHQITPSPIDPFVFKKRENMNDEKAEVFKRFLQATN